jgi:CsoR family transcriptional regulator, copper-sensing transcriptional repressor
VIYAHINLPQHKRPSPGSDGHNVKLCNKFKLACTICSTQPIYADGYVSITLREYASYLCRKFLDKSAANASHTHAENLPTADEHTHNHVHSKESRKGIINRLSRVEGHVRGIKTMVQESRPCPDVLVQIAAVRGALDRVARIILDEHLTECVARAAEAGNIDIEIVQLKAALDRFLD